MSRDERRRGGTLSGGVVPDQRRSEFFHADLLVLRGQGRWVALSSARFGKHRRSRRRSTSARRPPPKVLDQGRVDKPRYVRTAWTFLPARTAWCRSFRRKMGHLVYRRTGGRGGGFRGRAAERMAQVTQSRGQRGFALTPRVEDIVRGDTSGLDGVGDRFGDDSWRRVGGTGGLHGRAER
jgi:hypothetical protein